MFRFARHIFRTGKALRQDQRGSAATEFALTFPIYIATIMFLVEVARIAYTQGVIIHAAEEATRYALVRYDATTDEIQDLARSNLLGLTAENLTAIIVTAPTDPADQTRLVSVEVQYLYTPILPINALLPGDDVSGFTLTGSSRGFITEEIPSF